MRDEAIYCVNCDIEALRFFEYERKGINPGVGVDTWTERVPLCAQCEDAFRIGQRHPEVNFRSIEDWEV